MTICLRNQAALRALRNTDLLAQAGLLEPADAYLGRPLPCLPDPASNEEGVLHLDQNVCVTTPELTWISLARNMSPQCSTLLGLELCGSFLGRPRTSARRLAAYVDRCPDVIGHREARRVVNYLRDGARTVEEAVLALLLGLPAELGGQGIDMPSFDIQPQLTHGSYQSVAWPRCGLLWERQRVALTFDPELQDVCDTKPDRAVNRQRQLAQADVVEVCVDASVLADERAFMQLAHHLRSLCPACWTEGDGTQPARGHDAFIELTDAMEPYRSGTLSSVDVKESQRV